MAQDKEAMVQEMALMRLVENSMYESEATSFNQAIALLPS